jgi:type III secretory pathway component EscT
MKKIIMFFLIVGFLLLIAGFLYSVYVNIPPQDPPPAVAEAYARQEKTESVFYLSGAVCIAAGLVLKIVAFGATFLRRMKN